VAEIEESGYRSLACVREQVAEEGKGGAEVGSSLDRGDAAVGGKTWWRHDLRGLGSKSSCAR
jgi:hypothetical protein